MGASDLIDEKIIKVIAKNYNPLGHVIQLAALLKTAYPGQDFSNLAKYELHKLLNQLLIENYPGEQIFKYKLFQQFFSQKNIVAAFEINVNNSRADFLTINGHTSCFEIKTALDNLTKLPKQMSDYMSAFEYNYLIVSECHLAKAKEVLPRSFGLWLYKNSRIEQIKKAELNEKINPWVQLGLLTRQELLRNYQGQSGKINQIVNSCSSETINNRFKLALKARYHDRWKFVVENQKHIFPVDLQFFFNTNILPKHIYSQ
jgi:hypothetical protein